MMVFDFTSFNILTNLILSEKRRKISQNLFFENELNIEVKVNQRSIKNMKVY